jgi:hypothetical protein
MDLFGSNRVASLGGKLYAFVIVDDFSRFTWVLFLTHKNEAHIAFAKFCKKVQNEIGCTIINIHSDRCREFNNHDIEKYCDDHGFTHNFSAPRTPQQNGVVECKNRSLQEMARTMLNEHSLPKYFWAEAVNTACYIINRVVIRSKLEKTPYELWKGRTPNIGYFKVFGCKCFILNDKDNLGKFDAKSDEGIFLGYSMNSKAYRVYNKRSLTIEESMHVVFDEVDSLKPKIVDDDDNDINVIENKVNDIKMRDQASQVSNKEESIKNASHLEQEQQFPKSWRIVKDHPIDQILGDPSQGVNTRSSLRNVCNNMAFVSEIEPKNIEEAETDEFWLMVMEEELNQFERNNVWTLVPRPTHQSIIGTKWVFRNKKDENGIIIRNKARLVAQGFNQEEGVDYEETFAPVTRLEAIRMLLAFACYKDFKFFQMDVNSAILNGLISE